MAELRADIKNFKENRRCQLCTGKYHLDTACYKCNSCPRCCRSWRHPLSKLIDFNEFRIIFNLKK